MVTDVTTAYCKYCKKNVKLTPKSQQWLVTALKYDGLSCHCYVECAECGDLFLWEFSACKPTKTSSLTRCPELFCYGYVVQNKLGEVKHLHKIDVHCWSCGECGTVWTSRDALDEQIERMIKK